MRELPTSFTGDGFNHTFPYQKCLERYGRLPELTSFSNWSNQTTCSDTIWDLKKLTSLNSVFNTCFQVENIDLTGYDSSVTSCYYAFRHCWKLRYLNNTDKLVTSSCTSINQIFYNCFLLPFVDSSNWNTQNVTTMQSAFNGCANLYKLDVSNFNTAKVTTFQSMFAGCYKLKTIDVSGFDTSKVTGTGYAGMFANCVRVE
jgi:surface protein